MEANLAKSSIVLSECSVDSRLRAHGSDLSRLILDTVLPAFTFPYQLEYNVPQTIAWSLKAIPLLLHGIVHLLELYAAYVVRIIVSAQNYHHLNEYPICVTIYF